jgi:hypothetical protein
MARLGQGNANALALLSLELKSLQAKCDNSHALLSEAVLVEVAKGIETSFSHIEARISAHDAVLRLHASQVYCSAVRALARVLLLLTLLCLRSCRSA